MGFQKYHLGKKYGKFENYHQVSYEISVLRIIKLVRLFSRHFLDEPPCRLFLGSQKCLVQIFYSFFTIYCPIFTHLCLYYSFLTDTILVGRSLALNYCGLHLVVNMLEPFHQKFD